MTLLQYKYISITLFFLLLSYSRAQTIKSFKFTNNHIFNGQTLIEQVKDFRNKQYNEALQDSILNRLYKFASGEGYIKFKVNRINILPFKDSQNVMLEINVDEGKPAIVNKIFIQNLNKSDSLNILPFFNNLERKVFNKFEIENAVNQSLDYYENNGYPFTQVNIKSFFFFNDSLTHQTKTDIFISIDKLKKSKIDKIEVVGNTKTNIGVIIRNSRLKVGELYSEKRINDIPRQLNKLRFFRVIGKPKYYFNSKDEGILQIDVKELQTNQFDGIIGYVPASPNRKGYFTGFVNINLRNMFGTGRGASIKWQQENQSTQELELKYLEPWIFNYPFNIKLDLFQRKQDSTYVQRKFTGNIEFLATENISASLIFSTESTIPNQSNSNRFTVFNSNIFTTGVDLIIDTRNDILLPKSGIYFNNSYKFSSKKINGPQKYLTSSTILKSTMQRLELGFSFYYSIFKNNVVSFSVNAKELKSNSIETSDLFRFGGTNTVRGYREKQFLGNRIIWSNLEYRFMLPPESYAFAFYDLGYYLKNGNKILGINEEAGIISSYGLGFSFTTALGLLKVSYAIPKGGALNKGLIHFGIQNEF